MVIEVTVIEQVAVPKVMAPALKLMIFGCVTVAVPEQPAPLKATVAPDVNCNPVGKVSINAMPVCAGFPAAFVTVNTNVLAAFSFNGEVVNALVMTGLAVTDKHWSTTWFNKPPCNALMLVVALVKFACGQVPVIPVAFVTKIVTVQEAKPATISTPATVMLPAPATAVRLSAAPVLLVQLPPNVTGLATTNPTGRVSVKPTSLVMGAEAGLVMVKVSVAFSPLPISVGLNALVSAGCATIVSVAFTLLVMPGESPLMLPALLV